MSRHIAIPGPVRLCAALLATVLVASAADPAVTGDHWAFRPVRPPAVPTPRDEAWPRGDIDRFVGARRESAGLRPVADAAPESLLRRLSFDLTGLPPTPERIMAFTAAQEGGGIDERAYARIVDEMLASPAFGERWGRHWLDVARFAESTGKERNRTFPEAWRYRDWVIGAFHDDKPYDVFVREQIAGDLLARTASTAERDAATIATGFLALGPKSLNERRREQFLADLVDEQIDVTTRAFLGATVACARCHDHKSDPFTQRDYYALAGIFRSTETCYGTSADAARNRQPSRLIPLADSPTAEPMSPGPAAGRRRRGATASGFAFNPATNALAMGVREGTVGDAFLLLRGEVGQRGPRIPRGVPDLAGDRPRMPARESGRLELAEWIASPSNPLTARVAVNRVWAHLFGRGIVATPDDFGRNGVAPSHPELLDHLAAGFVAEGWSTKRLVRRIVLSRTYRLSTRADPDAMEADPDDVLLWRARPRRLDAECVRDAMLAASGELDTRPPRGSWVAQAGDVFIGGRYRGERVDESFRKRAVYLPVVRGAVVDSLEVFDFAEPSLVVTVRDETNVPAQALHLMNSPFALARCRALARRILSAPGDERARIMLAHRRVLGRSANTSEIERARAFLARETAATDTPDGRPAGAESAWASYVQALFGTAEFRHLR